MQISEKLGDICRIFEGSMARNSLDRQPETRRAMSNGGPSPDSPEIPDGLDNDMDGEVDEGADNVYVDEVAGTESVGATRTTGGDE
jgi:hypothetical protein